MIGILNHLIDMTFTIPPIISLCIATIALIIGIKNYLRKAGVRVRGVFTICSSRECDDQFVKEIILENLKDRAVTIFSIYLKVGHNYYIELENLEDKPLVLKAFETYQKHFGPIEFYGVNTHKVGLNPVLDDPRAKRKLVLSTSDGRYEVPSIMRRWSPTFSYFKNYATVIARPIRSTFKETDLGNNIRFVIEFVPNEGKEELVLIHPRDYELKIFRKFSLTQESLEDKKSLEQFLEKTKNEGKIQAKKIIVHDIQEWREQAHSFYSDERVQAEYVNAFKYYVVGRIYSVYFNWKTDRENAQRRKVRQ